MAGLAELASLPAERVLTLRYEDFLTSPQESIAALLAFLDPEPTDDAWVERVAAMVRPARPAWHDLPAAELASLEEACRPGFAALAGLYPEGS